MNQTRQPKESGGVYILLDFMCNVDEQTRIIFEDPRRRTSPIPKYFPEASMDEIGRKEILSSRKNLRNNPEKPHGRYSDSWTVEQSATFDFISQVRSRQSVQPSTLRRTCRVSDRS